jgi:hypothetical protein
MGGSAGQRVTLWSVYGMEIMLGHLTMTPWCITALVLNHECDASTTVDEQVARGRGT